MEGDSLEDMLFGSLSQDTYDGIEMDCESSEEMLNEGLESDYGDAEFEWDQGSNAPWKDVDPDAEMLEYDEAEFYTEMLHTTDTENTAAVVKDKDWVIDRVEAMLEDVLRALLEHTEMAITLHSRTTGKARSANAKLAGEEDRPLSRVRKITFPGSSAKEAWRFTVLLKLLETVHDCLIEDVVVTKRDIYYRHPNLFVKQSVVDKYVDDLACTFGVSRSSLNVTAAAKGLVAGNFTLSRSDETLLSYLSEKEGMLVPKIGDTDTLDLSFVRWVLVIEKEATFRSIMGSSYWKTLGPSALMLTAKGYPDLASRKFLRHVANRSPHIPMYALVDFDPDGIAIMSTYKHGSYSLAHENMTSTGAPGLNLPELCWLGVQGDQIFRSPAGERDTERGATSDAQGLMRLTPRDRMKASRMLEWDLLAETGPEPTWRRELQTMLMLNVKAEMQILEERPGGLAAWLEEELQEMERSGEMGWSGDHLGLDQDPHDCSQS